MVIFLGGSIGEGIVWEKLMSVGMVPEVSTVASLSDSNYLRGKVELVIILDKRWGSGVK